MQSILKSADKKADEALSGSTYEQGSKGDDVEAPSVGDKASDASEKAKESTGSAWEATKQGTSDAVGTTKDKTGSAWESTKEGSADAAEKTKDTTGKAWESTKQGTSDAAEATKEKAVQAKDESANLLQAVREQFIKTSLFICTEFSHLENSSDLRTSVHGEIWSYVFHFDLN
ncbi:hypothetical protein KC19_1G123400 [Ceratodon purpureus]|uniref:Uncharacterized protein n=1 Tax=Ceratodon purpureus TaxID=3225 RepID=A0A8T0J570_CERPU|nr:hypothetical protein KC19_1G123400 [Ceratodon purpureus]